MISVNSKKPLFKALNRSFAKTRVLAFSPQISGRMFFTRPTSPVSNRTFIPCG